VTEPWLLAGEVWFACMPLALAKYTGGKMEPTSHGQIFLSGLR